MNMVTALAIAAGVLVAVWVKLSVLINVPYWYVGVFGWAAYMAAGGGMNGLKKAIPAGVAGMLLVAAAEMVALMTGHMEMEWLLLGAATFVAVFLSRFAFLSFVPAAFAGAAIIGAGGPVGIFDLITNVKLGIAFVAGTVIGYVADAVARMMAKKA
jgi:branched-subunit amino acid transport protein AzlD